MEGDGNLSEWKAKPALVCYFALLGGIFVCVLNNLRRKVLYEDSMKFKIKAKAHNGKVKREYIIEASNGEELSREIRRVEREWVLETGILDFTITV